MRDQGGFSTRQKWGAAFALFGLGLPLLQWGLEARGVNLSPAQGNLLLVLAALSFLGGLSIIFWSWVARLWPWVWGQIKQRWPFALARTARQLRLRLGEAGQEIQRLSTENEQLEQSNENLKAERKQLSDLLQDTKRENRKLKQQLEVLRAGELRTRIEKWRSVILDFDFAAERFAGTDTYSQMKREGLRPEVVEMFEAQRTFHVGNEARGDPPYRHILLDEVARIEKERGLT